VYNFPKLVYFEKAANKYYVYPISRDRSFDNFHDFTYSQVYTQAYLQSSLPSTPENEFQKQKIKFVRGMQSLMEENARALTNMGLAEPSWYIVFVFSFCFTLFPFYMIYNFLKQFCA